MRCLVSRCVKIEGCLVGIVSAVPVLVLDEEGEVHEGRAGGCVGGDGKGDEMGCWVEPKGAVCKSRRGSDLVMRGNR